MIFLSLVGGVWFASNTWWWNHLYECQVGLFAWDHRKISRALMNIKHTHDLVMQHNDNDKNCGGYNVIGKPLKHAKCFRFNSLLHLLQCV